MFDTHTHTHHSCDSQATMEEMAAMALAIELQGIAFTDHVEWMPEDEATGYMKPQAYFQELEQVRRRYQRQLEILAGVEIGSSHLFPNETRALMNAYPWDLVIGSVHWFNGTGGWLPAAFENGMEAAYTSYYTELNALAREGEYDILAHFDIIRRDTWKLYRRELPATPFAELIQSTLQAVIDRGKGLEINTSGLWRGMNEGMPGLTILRWYREMGGEILVFGSDAHEPDNIAREFERAQNLALAAGFTHFAHYRQRELIEWIEI